MARKDDDKRHRSERARGNGRGGGASRKGDVDREAGRGQGRADGDGSRRSGGLVAIARRGAQQLSELTGRTAEFVSRMEPGDDGWLLTVEVLEVERVPDSTSLLASYEVEVDSDGNLVEYARLRRYVRSQSDLWEA